MHPTHGDATQLAPIALEEEFVRLALQQGADIDIVKTAVAVEESVAIPGAGIAKPRSDAAETLDVLGGVGALLRFALN